MLPVVLAGDIAGCAEPEGKKPNRSKLIARDAAHIHMARNSDLRRLKVHVRSKTAPTVMVLHDTRECSLRTLCSADSLVYEVSQTVEPASLPLVY